MLTLKDLFDQVLVDSGQFIIPDDRIELVPARFKLLVERVVGIYNGYSPIDQKVYLSVLGSRQYEFKDTFHKYGIPESISDVIPIRVLGALPYGFNVNKSLNTWLEERGMVPYTYRKPILTLPFSADFEVHCIWNHRLVKIEGDEDTWGIDTIKLNDREFFDLLSAKFLQAIGRSRRAFTLNDLPITSDAAELVAEGKELEEKAMTDLIENKMKWYLAW